jgi:tetratricopeptide (TPR) repeat protein
MRKTLFIIFVMIWLTGCGATALRQGRSYIEREQYSQAVEVLTNALNQEPDNPKIHRDLGIAYYGMDQYQQSLNELTIAKQKLKKDGSVIFYLGLIYEKSEQYEKAIEEYTQYIQLSRFSPMRKQIQERVQLLIRKEADLWARKRIEDEEKIVVSEIPNNSVAVTYFKPNNVSERLEPLHKGLTDLLINDLTLIEGLTVVERIKLKEIYDELALATTDLVDQKRAPLEMGSLLGANTLITGTFTTFGEDEHSPWRIEPSLGMVKANEIAAIEGIEGNFAQFIQVEKKLALQILDYLDIELTAEEQNRIAEKIKQNIPTESLEAFLAYSRGLDYQDSGVYGQAENEFEKAVSIDRNFDNAKIQLNTTKVLSKASIGVQASPEVPPISSADSLEREWVAAVSEEDLRNELLSATVAVISQTDIEDSEDKVPPTKTEPQSPESPEKVRVEVVIEW